MKLLVGHFVEGSRTQRETIIETSMTFSGSKAKKQMAMKAEAAKQIPPKTIAYVMEFRA